MKNFVKALKCAIDNDPNSKVKIKASIIVGDEKNPDSLFNRNDEFQLSDLILMMDGDEFCLKSTGFSMEKIEEEKAEQEREQQIVSLNEKVQKRLVDEDYAKQMRIREINRKFSWLVGDAAKITGIAEDVLLNLILERKIKSMVDSTQQGKKIIKIFSEDLKGLINQGIPDMEEAKFKKATQKSLPQFIISNCERIRTTLKRAADNAISSNDLAEMFGVGRPTLESWFSDLGMVPIPRTNIRSHLLWKVSDVIEFIQFYQKDFQLSPNETVV